jgi:formylglycine-generating enzyme required for sulfatase activity
VVLGLIALWLGRRRASWLAVLLIGCATEVDPAQPDAPPPAVFGVSCPDHEDGAIDDMIVVPSIAGRAPYCIDRYEASLDDAKVEARSRRFTLPARGVTWSQARDACGAVGKRLCTADEWLTACRGDQDQTYPYGETFEPTSCNGFAAGRGDAVETGAMIIRGADDLAAGCVTQHGAYDLSGNVWEWNATEYLDGARRGLAGGSFRSNAIGLRCVAQDNHAVPGEVDDAYGFRCCIDLP